MRVGNSLRKGALYQGRPDVVWTWGGFDKPDFVRVSVGNEGSLFYPLVELKFRFGSFVPLSELKIDAIEKLLVSAEVTEHL